MHLSQATPWHVVRTARPSKTLPKEVGALQWARAMVSPGIGWVWVGFPFWAGPLGSESSPHCIAASRERPNTFHDLLRSEEGSGFLKANWNVLGFAGAKDDLAHVAPTCSRKTDLGRNGGMRSRLDDLGLSFVFLSASSYHVKWAIH